MSVNMTEWRQCPLDHPTPHSKSSRRRTAPTRPSRSSIRACHACPSIVVLRLKSYATKITSKVARRLVNSVRRLSGNLLASPRQAARDSSEASKPLLLLNSPRTPCLVVVLSVPTTQLPHNLRTQVGSVPLASPHSRQRTQVERVCLVVAAARSGSSSSNSSNSRSSRPAHLGGSDSSHNNSNSNSNSNNLLLAVCLVVVHSVSKIHRQSRLEPSVSSRVVCRVSS